MPTISFEIDESLAAKFDMALMLTGKTADDVLGDQVRRFVAQTFESAANSLKDANDTPSASNIQPQRRTARRVAPPNNVQPYREVPDDNTDSQSEVFGEWGKAIGRIPRWAKNPQQYNHKILRAFFELQKELGIGHVTIDALRQRCSDPTVHPRTYVPHFDNNYTQMKFDNGNSHGKVFEEKDGIITLWDRISDTLMRYRDYFT